MVKLRCKYLLWMGAVPLAGLVSARGATPQVPSNEFATIVSSYTQGTVASYDTGYSDTTDWTGVPTGTTGAPEGSPGVVTPFYPPFDTSQILLIGNGGHLTLQFPNPIGVISSSLFGVFSTSGFIDSGYERGMVNSTAGTFGGGLATMQVSQDGVHWYSLGTQDIDVPQNYYLNAGPYDTIAPSNPQLASYGVPYTGSLSAFKNETDAQVITTLNGSAGGTWINVGASGLSQVDYVQFTPPANAPTNWQFAVEAVTNTLPEPIPEPASLISNVGLIALTFRRPRRSVQADCHA